MAFELLVILATASLVESQLTFMTNQAVFKGLPELPDIDTGAGEKRIIYYHDQVVAVVDLRQNNRLRRCELVETYEPTEAFQVLKNLTSRNYGAYEASFKDILKLMQKCDKLDDNKIILTDRNVGTPTNDNLAAGNLLMFGIVPGTKWCGTGDIAKNYHDLGIRSDIDRCCRMHDLCPIKIRAYKSRYNLYNNSFYSKSHCVCDEAFYNCLKKVNQVGANIIGNIYFNVAQPMCLDSNPRSKDEDTMIFKPTRRAF